MSERSAQANDPKRNNKNKAKDASGKGWCTDDLFFDEEGCIYVANKDLADAIQASLDAWGGHLTIYRDRRPDEMPSVEELERTERTKAMDRPGGWHPMTAKRADGGEADPAGTDAATLTAAPDTTTTKEYAGPQVNMMCPCAPEP